MTPPPGPAPVGPVLSPSTVAIFAEAAGWPRVTIGVLEIVGEDAWRRALASSPVPAELRALVAGVGAPWACDALIATDAARVRLRRWVDAGRPEPRPQDAPVITGDQELRSRVEAALALVPAPMRHHLELHGVVVVVDAGAGLCAADFPAAPGAQEGRRLLVVARGAGADISAVERQFAGAIVHEAAHQWLLPPLPLTSEPRPPADATARRAALFALGREVGRLGDLAADAERSEVQAAALTRALGFDGVCADGAACARNGLRMLDREASAALGAPIS